MLFAPTKLTRITTKACSLISQFLPLPLYTLPHPAAWVIL